MSDQGRRQPGRHQQRGRSERSQPRPTRAIQPARLVAYDVLRAVEESDAYANLALPPAIAVAGLSAQDAALATELTYGTLRRRGTYDAVIARAANRAVSDIDGVVLDALRLGVHQLLETRVAAHAAVDESVSLAGGHGGRSAAGFANAVLRRIGRQDADTWYDELEDQARSDDERLSVRTAHPVWIIRALRRALSAEGREHELPELLAADNVSPEVTLIALPGLAERGAPARPYAPTAFAAGAGDPARTIRESGGRVRVQDEGSQLAALALAGASPARSGERWLDLCAGPGGKTALLAALARERGVQLEANEPVPTRAGLVRRALEAVPLDVPVHEEDGRAFASSRAGEFDRILVDAPCTGLGALRRRPEARWRKSPADVGALTALQEELLTAAVDALRPGGLVAYVTCSPHLAETVGVVDTVRRARPALSAVDTRAVLQQVSEAPMDLASAQDGSLHAQLWPHRHGTDAMFIALLRKEG